MTITSLVGCLSVIRDPRQESKIEHELIDILVLCVFGVICGAEGWQDIEEVGHSRLNWLQERGFFVKMGSLLMIRLRALYRAFVQKSYNAVLLHGWQLPKKPLLARLWPSMEKRYAILRL